MAKIIINSEAYKKARFSLLLREPTKAGLKKIADVETAGSLNELINRICEDYLAKHYEAVMHGGR